MLTQFETDSITRAIVALERIADALETIMDRMPEEPEYVEDDPPDLPFGTHPSDY